MEIRTESPTIDALRRVADQGPQGATWKLAELTPYPWDEVICFGEGTRREAIAAATDDQLFPGGEGRLWDPGPLLVFRNGGRVVEAVQILPPLHLSSRSPGVPRSPAEATVRAHSAPPAPHLLLLE